MNLSCGGYICKVVCSQIFALVTYSYMPLDIYSGPILIDEFDNVLNKKAAGHDGIRPELFKYSNI